MGEGIEDGMRKMNLKREDLYVCSLTSFIQYINELTRGDIQIQTKFTSINGQDPNNIPYDATASIPDQIHQSVSKSLENLRLNTISSINQPSPEETKKAYLDCLLLHSPLHTFADTLLAFNTLATYVPHTIRHLGISNVTFQYLQTLVTHSELNIKPSIVQNRFHAQTDYDTPLRAFCRSSGIIYQSFWTLTANPALLRSRVVKAVAEKMEVTKEEALYGLVLGLKGVVVLDGTKQEKRMEGDLEFVARWGKFEEENEEVVEEWIGEFEEDLESLVGR